MGAAPGTWWWLWICTGTAPSSASVTQRSDITALGGWLWPHPWWYIWVCISSVEVMAATSEMLEGLVLSWESSQTTKSYSTPCGHFCQLLTAQRMLTAKPGKLCHVAPQGRDCWDVDQVCELHWLTVNEDGCRPILLSWSPRWKSWGLPSLEIWRGWMDMSVWMRRMSSSLPSSWPFPVACLP